MMKWGRKKSSLSTNPHLISHVIPNSWFSRSKKTSDSAILCNENMKVEEKKNSSYLRRPLRSSWSGGQFYGGVDDSYRRLLFADERCEGQHLKSVRCDSDDELKVNLLSHQCSRHRGMELEVRELAGRRQISEPPQHVEIMQGNYKCEAEKEGAKSKALERRALKDVNSRNMHQRVNAAKHTELPRKLQAEVENSTKAIEKDIIEVEHVRIIQTEKDYQKSLAALKLQKERGGCTKDSNLRTIQERGAFAVQKLEQPNAASNEELPIGWQNFKDMKIKEIMSKSEEQRINVFVRRESPRKRKKQVRKVRVYSPRTAARIEYKIRAVEDLKKTKMKTNKVRKQRAAKEATAFDSFAVVKSSIDPQEDFKISMAEMITVIGIRKAQDLEELLVCYLTLNCDEYHDLIIKVFWQVWFELNHVQFDPSMQTKHCRSGNRELSQL